MREIVQLTLKPDFDLAKTAALVPKQSRADLAQAIVNYESALHPLNKLEPTGDGPNSQDCLALFAPIGSKMRPDMSIAQGKHWATAVVLALSDLPAFAVRKALRDGLHIPHDFPSEMERKLREIGEQELLRHRTALHRLKLLMEEFARMANPQPQIADQSAEPMSLDEIRKTPAFLRRLGISSGAILQADLDVILAEEQTPANGATA